MIKLRKNLIKNFRNDLTFRLFYLFIICFPISVEIFYGIPLWSVSHKANDNLIELS